MLGKAEMLLSRGELFVPLDMKDRIFGRATIPRPRESRTVEKVADTKRFEDAALRASFDAGSQVRIVVDGSGKVVLANRAARTRFSITPATVGRSVSELDLPLRPTDLGALLDKALQERRPVAAHAVEGTLPSGDKSFSDVEVTPISSETGSVLGALIAFVDVTRTQRLEIELRRSNLELDAFQRALRATEVEAARTFEELAVVKEEQERLGSTLLATKEDLAATSEELEATSEELEALNEELYRRGGEAHHANALMHEVLGRLPMGVAVLDRDLRVLVWNAKMGAIWNKEASDIERRSLHELDVAWPGGQIAAAAAACHSNGEASVLAVDGTRPTGERVARMLTVLPLRQGPAEGVVILVEEVS
jgi:two-component system CheB/CheR fusion protein